MAHVQQKSIDQVGLEGPGLVFIVYPEAIAMMSGSVFWSIIFFLMLITLGLDSTFGGLEAMITALCDEYPRALGRRREWFVFVLLILIYLCALPTMTYVSRMFLNIYFYIFIFFLTFCYIISSSLRLIQFIVSDVNGIGHPVHTAHTFVILWTTQRIRNVSANTITYLILPLIYK